MSDKSDTALFSNQDKSVSSPTLSNPTYRFDWYVYTTQNNIGVTQLYKYDLV